MKKKMYSAVILLSLAAPALVLAADNGENVEVHGTVELGVQGVSTNGNEARFQEFLERDDAVLGNIQLDALKGAYHFQFDGSDIGLDDQSLEVKGGEYGNFKYKFDYDEMTHNYGFDLITPYTGIGTRQINFTADPADIATWTHFDDKVGHKRYSGEMEISMDSPYFVSFGAERREESGLRPYSTHRPVDSEVPEPISNTTDNVHLKAGYRGDSLTTSVTGFMSFFSNDNKYMTTDTPPDYSNIAVLAPDNDYGKLSADLTLRDLPLSSVLSAAAGYSNLDTSYSAADLNLPARLVAGLWNIGGLAGVNTNTFNGEVEHTSFSAALSSSPVDKMDSKIYYRYLQRDNKSDIISYGTTTNAGELLSYDKDTAGIDIGYRLPQKTKLGAGYEYVKTDRSTPDGTNLYPTDSNKDQSEYIELKNRALDFMTAKVRYTHASRDAGDFEADAPIPFAYQDQSSDAWKLGFGFAPMDRLDLGLDFGYKTTDYDESANTRTDDTRTSVYLDAAWHVQGQASLSAFGGYEKVETDANRITSEGNLTPDYSQTIDDDFWTYGLVGNVPGLLDDKLTLNLSWRYQKSDGQTDFSDTSMESIVLADDYTKKTLEAKAIYALAPKLSMTVGYIYENFEYEDLSMADFPTTYTFSTTSSRGTSNYYLSGLYADQNYEANIGYLMVAYKF